MIRGMSIGLAQLECAESGRNLYTGGCSIAYRLEVPARVCGFSVDRSLMLDL